MHEQQHQVVKAQVLGQMERAEQRKLRVKGKADEVDTMLVDAAAAQSADILSRLQDALDADEAAIAAAAAGSPHGPTKDASDRSLPA